MLKKILIFISIAILFAVSLISAVEFDMKENFNQGETLMARISGNFLQPILQENIFLYRGHVRIPLEPYVTNIGGDYYIYSQLLGKATNNYSLSIENVKYMKGADISDEAITKNFSISNITADFLIKPGFIKTNEDFFIEVQNLQDYKITIDSDVEGSESTLLKSGQIKKIYFQAEKVSDSKTIKLSTNNLSYEIPILVSFEIILKERNLRFQPLEFEISLSTDSDTNRIVYLYNIGDEVLENISLYVSDSLSSYISLSKDNIKQLNKNENSRIEIYINSSDKEENPEGYLVAKTENISAYVFLSLNFIKDFQPSNESEPPLTISQTCEELGGEICTNEKKCDEEGVYAKDGVCCLGKCTWPKNRFEDSAGKIIGWTMVIVMVGFVVWFFAKKYRGAKRPFNLLKIARGKKK